MFSGLGISVGGGGKFVEQDDVSDACIEVNGVGRLTVAVVP